MYMEMEKGQKILILGRFLRDAREKSGLTLSEVADKMQWGSTQFVWNLEHEVSVIPIKYIRKLSKLYRISDVDLRKQIVVHLTRKIKRKYGLQN